MLRKEVSVGNLLSIGTILVSAAIAWGILTSRVGSTETKMETVEKKVETVRDDISTSKVTLGRMDEKLRSVERSMDEQKQLIKEVLTKVK